MTKKLEGNGLWESSRMILPQYRERIVRAAVERDDRRKPIPHGDQLEGISEAVKLSLTMGIVVRLELHEGPDGKCGWTEGVVIDASPLQGMLKLREEFGEERRIAYADIVGAETRDQ